MRTAFCVLLAVRLGDKGATDLLGVNTTQWTAFSTERLSKLWFMPHVGTLAFSIDKDSNEKLILYKTFHQWRAALCDLNAFSCSCSMRMRRCEKCR